MEIAVLAVACVLSAIALRLSFCVGWHWSAAIFFGAIPIAATFFLGIIGLLASAVFVGGLYMATA